MCRERCRTCKGLDPQSARKVKFFTRQFVDALSPSNFVLTNPEVLKRTVETGGQNLLEGLNHLLQDLDRGHGKLAISMTDYSGVQARRERGQHTGQGGVPERPDAVDPVPAQHSRGLSRHRC